MNINLYYLSLIGAIFVITLPIISIKIIQFVFKKYLLPNLFKHSFAKALLGLLTKLVA